MSEITSQPKKQKLWVKIGVPVAALLVGIGMGGTGKQVERVEVPGKQGVPEVCLTALTKADEGFQHSGEGFMLAADSMGAVSRFDVEGIEAATAKMDLLAPKLDRALVEYGAARDECRAASRG